jgi:hypothetical protein
VESERQPELRRRPPAHQPRSGLLPPAGLVLRANRREVLAFRKRDHHLIRCRLRSGRAIRVAIEAVASGFGALFARLVSSHVCLTSIGGLHPEWILAVAPFRRIQTPGRGPMFGGDVQLWTDSSEEEAFGSVSRGLSGRRTARAC